MTKSVTIYTSNSCAYCVMVKKFLTMKGHQYEEVNVELDPSVRQQVIDKYGATTVPVTVVEKIDGTESIAIGYNVSQLSSALA